MQMNFNMNLPGLKGVLVEKMEEKEEAIHIHIALKRVSHTCPSCKMLTSKVHDYRIQKITHLKWFERITILFYKKRRYVCTHCGKRFSESNNFVQKYQRFSKEWNQAVKLRSIHAKSFKEIGEIYQASPSTILRRFDQLTAEEKIQSEQVELPKVIAIDEYKGDTDAGKFQLVIANAETRQPIDILPNRKKETIKHYLSKYGANVQMVVMDMNASFKAAVNQALNRPTIIADRFHYCRYILWALDGVRRRVQKEWNAYDRKRNKRMRHIFYKRNDELSEKECWYLNRYLGFSEELRKAYELKEAYYQWFEEAKVNQKSIKSGLLEYYQLVKKSKIPEFIKAIKTFKNWQTEIINSFLFPYSNGFLEGLNNKTKVIKRNAYGFKSFIRFKAKIILAVKYKNKVKHIG